jgi:DNA-binding LytR/AlgR family response regulator
MNAIIIEDEDIAAIKLQNMIQELDPGFNIVRILSSVKESVVYLKENQPDVIFLDINLSDDNSFEIFNQVEDIQSKIVFTTAYSEYAIKAFEQNSIDYLLKPIPKEALQRSLAKLRKYDTKEKVDYNKILFHPEDVYKKRFLIKTNNSLKTVEIDEVAYFYSEDKVTFIKLRNDKKLPIEFSLKNLEELLNPKKFYRVNRKYIVHITAISKMYYSSKSKIMLHLQPAAEEEQIPVAIEKVGKFKKWLSN